MNQIPKNKKNLADSVSTRFSMVAGGVLRTTDLRLIASRRFAVPKTAYWLAARSPQFRPLHQWSLSQTASRRS